VNNSDKNNLLEKFGAQGKTTIGNSFRTIVPSKRKAIIANDKKAKISRGCSGCSRKRSRH